MISKSPNPCMTTFFIRGFTDINLYLTKKKITRMTKWDQENNKLNAPTSSTF